MYINRGFVLTNLTYYQRARSDREREMEKKSASQLGLVLFLLVVLLVPTHTESALPSQQESLLVIGSRRLMSSYKTNSNIHFGGSTSGQAGGGKQNP
ncbi:unnamed protein product [Arabidopsis halleri]